MKKDSPSIPYFKILVPFDGSEGAVKALRRALSLAKLQGCAVTTLSVDEHVPRYAPGVGAVEEEEELRKAYFADLRSKAHALARKFDVDVETATAVGHAAQSILWCAHEVGADLIVIGHSGRSGVWGTLLGSTTARVVDQATCDVLVVR